MNREKVKQLINNSVSAQLKSEIYYFIGTCECDVVDALDYAHDFSVENNERKLLKEIRLILIEAGYYVERQDRPTSCRDFRVTVNKVKYDCVGSWEAWIDE